MKISTIAALLLLILTSSCVHNSYFLSPFQANDHPYRAIPLVSDSTHKAVYASTAINIGSANEDLRDVVFNFQGSIHQSHTLDHFQFYYGANLSLGNYHLDQVNDPVTYNNPYPNYVRGGNRYFGGWGIFAGGDLVIPIKTTGSEWRVIGIESSYMHEFGDYLRFRKQLPDSAATANFRDNYFHTVGITTNVIKKFKRSGNSFGYKFGIYLSTRWQYEQPRTDYYPQRVIPAYVSNTLHFTKQRVTGFVQINAGAYALNFQSGINVLLGTR